MAILQLWRVARLMLCAAVAFVVCAVLTFTCGCSRVVSEDVEVHTTSQSAVDSDSVTVTTVVAQSTSESNTDESLAGVLTRIVDDSLDVTLKVTEYGDDGVLRKVTEATLHRGKKDTTSGVVQQNCHTSNVETIDVAIADSSHVATSSRRDETDSVKRVVERRGWWAMHWRMVLSVFAAAVLVALAVWKRRRWLPVVVNCVRRF